MVSSSSKNYVVCAWENQRGSCIAALLHFPKNQAVKNNKPPPYCMLFIKSVACFSAKISTKTDELGEMRIMMNTWML